MARIRPACDDYKALRALWVNTFGDKADFVDDFYKVWGEDIEGYVLEDDDCIASALTMFLMGELVIPSDCIVTSRVGSASVDIRKPAYVSYAICTDSSARGQGFGSQITEYARDLALSRGAVSLLCPAEPSLVRFYQPLSYEPRFYATEAELSIASAAGISTGASDSETPDIELLSAEAYGRLREELLKDTVHIELSSRALKYIASTHRLYSMCGGRIIAALIKDTSDFAEVICDPLIEARELESVLAALGAELGLETLTYRTPGNEYLQTGTLSTEYIQAMIASDERLYFSNGYFGFPFD